MARQRRSPLMPPKAWSEDDGCSGVRDYHYHECCREHDWHYREWPATGLDDREARKLADEMLRECMQMANLRVSSTVERLIRWWWRPWLWWAVLRIVGSKHWTPLSERERR